MASVLILTLRWQTPPTPQNWGLFTSNTIHIYRYSENCVIETKEKHLQSSNPLKWLICILFTSQDSLCFLRMLMEAKLTSTSFASSPRKTWMVHLYNVDNRDDAFAGWWWWAFQPSTSSLNCLLVKRTPAQNPSKLYLENLKIFVIWKPENICSLKTWQYLFY